MSFNNVFKAIITVTTDRENTAIYKTIKQMYLFNTEVLPIDLGEQICNLIDNTRDIDKTTRTLTSKRDNVEEYRTEYLVQETLEDLKEIIGTKAITAG